jgi:hypothetical protein
MLSALQRDCSQVLKDRHLICLHHRQPQESCIWCRTNAAPKRQLELQPAELPAAGRQKEGQGQSLALQRRKGVLKLEEARWNKAQITDDSHGSGAVLGKITWAALGLA